MDEIIKKLLSKNKYPKIFTSATLTENGDYSYFKKNIGINKITKQSIIDEDPIDSPYNYDEQELIYIPKRLVNPNDREKFVSYTADIASKLIDLTEGRTLILFTSKSELEMVKNYLTSYHKIKYDLLYQSENTKLEFLKGQFMENENSILLSTGAWEGLDVKGSSLSSVIIPRLPFPLEDPIIKEKASLYVNPMVEVYLKEMGIKLRQGIGRAIRSIDDTALVTIFDRRVLTYYDYIAPLFPTINITREKRVVDRFVKENILK